MLTRDEKYPTGAIYFGPACNGIAPNGKVCGSRRTERIEGTSVRFCHVCGTRGKVRVHYQERGYNVYLEPINER